MSRLGHEYVLLFRLGQVYYNFTRFHAFSRCFTRDLSEDGFLYDFSRKFTLFHAWLLHLPSHTLVTLQGVGLYERLTLEDLRNFEYMYSRICYCIEQFYIVHIHIYLSIYIYKYYMICLLDTYIYIAGMYVCMYVCVYIYIYIYLVLVYS